MEPQYVFLIILAITLAVSALLLTLIGFTYTGKDKSLVIERMNEFYEVTTKGFVYRHPFLYHIVGRYKLTEKRAINKVGDYSVEITYQIIDVKKYHYSGHCFLDIIDERLRGIIDPEKIKDIILNIAEEVGIEVNSLNIYLTSDDSN